MGDILNGNTRKSIGNSPSRSSRNNTLLRLCACKRSFHLNETAHVRLISENVADLLRPEEIAEDAGVKGGDSHCLESRRVKEWIE